MSTTRIETANARTGCAVVRLVAPEASRNEMKAEPISLGGRASQLAKSRRRVLADSAQPPRPKRKWWRTDWSLSPWNETIGPRQRPRSRRCLRVAIIGVAEVAPPFSADASLLFRCGGASTSWRRSRTTGTRQSVRRSASDDPFRHDDADLGGYSFGDGVLVSGAGARPPLGHELQRDRRPMLTIALAVQTPSAGRSLSTASARTRSG